MSNQTKKKKPPGRKDRMKTVEDLLKKKEKEEELAKLVFQKDEEANRKRHEEKLKHEKECVEQSIRIERLTINVDKFRTRAKSMNDLRRHQRDEYSLDKFPGLKDLHRIVPWVNEFISGLRESGKDTNQIHVIQQCMMILSHLINYIDSGTPNIRIWHECKRDLRDEMYRIFDSISYRILKNVEKRMSYTDSETLYYHLDNDRFSLELWTVFDRESTSKDDKPNTHCHFELCTVNVHLPKSFHHQPVALRCLRLVDDYFSDDCETFYELEARPVDFLQYAEQNWQKLCTIRETVERDNARARLEKDKRRKILNKIRYMVPSRETIVVTSDTDVNTQVNETGDTESEKDKNSETVASNVADAKKTVQQLLLDDEKQEIQDIKRYYTRKLDGYELNLRKFCIVGGVYLMELLKQPPQPKILKDGSILRMIIGDDVLQRWEYLETYEPPVGKLTKQSTDDDDEEEDNTPEGKMLAKLVLVTISLPDDVLWFDTPIPVRWNCDRKYWSTEYIYETKFNEEKQILSFRLGKMSAIGLAAFKYVNFPFQAWELRLDHQADVAQMVFGITASTITVEFLIRRNEVALSLLENANTNALQQHVGIFYEPTVLVRILKQGGVDLFPSQDACLYVDGIPKKHQCTEDHLYHCMATVCICFNFSWSRWNVVAGYKKFVAQIRDRQKKNNELMLVTDKRASIVDCTDFSQSFNESSISGMEFYPDLLSLIDEYSSAENKTAIDNADIIFTETVYYMLAQTRVLSFS